MKRKTLIYKDEKFSKYECGDDGNIYRKGSSTPLKPWDNGHGYGIVDIMSDDNVSYRIKVHIAIAHTFLGKQPENTIVEHNNAKKRDCRPSNLSYETQRENVARAQVLVKGKKYLSSEEKKSILKSLKKKGISQVAKEHDLPYHVVRDLKYGKTYGGI